MPLETIPLAALGRLPANGRSPVVFPSPNGCYFNLHNFRNRYWKPAQLAAGITPLRRVYDLRHTFATFALRAGISTFELSRYMGTRLGMIDRHYGHLAKDGREHAIRLLDELSAGQRPRWTLRGRRRARTPPAKTTRASAKHGKLEALWRTRTADPLLTMPWVAEARVTAGNRGYTTAAKRRDLPMEV